ncbi:MAG: 30S ribosomal protein S12 methylthiotransferase RimO [Desulfobulbaceae bacterium]|uniref:Ribosomal protein uS12 methylthiotransferase RimO n=1 Tax=Candidatus Desulfatifera sulfidica TaxID=2841691 RepID=A0A8J6N955_9BACT|nr:30S ribosomal protein S12 methylthiotransferase RimO [Candidatus Desulfatifera sulfidica]
MPSLHLVSLGCPKNLVDSELMLGLLEQDGWQVVEDPRLADLLLINTCGFIQSAVEEAIAEILDLSVYKQENPEKFLVVTGCLVQRYGAELINELPEVDLFLGTEAVPEIVAQINDLRQGELVDKVLVPGPFLMTSDLPRRISTPFYRSWLKITEGCDNRCSYCLIPSIRGDLRSRTIDDLTVEAVRLESGGVRELCLIAQDLTAYGDDLQSGVALPDLLKNLLTETTIPWLRLLYLYPAGVNERLLELMARENRILPYLDIPMQHVSSAVLRRMNRRYTTEDLYAMIDMIRQYLPDVALRTTMMVGFPGETEADVRELEAFLRSARIDHVGSFVYANEPGAPSELFAGQVDDGEGQERMARIMAVQSEVSAGLQQRYVGRIEPVLLEGLSRESDLLLEGRTRFQAPDIDGCVYITDGEAMPGDIVQVRINEAQIYDLVGEIVGPA